MTLLRTMIFLFLLSSMGRTLADAGSTTIEVFIDGANSPAAGSDITIPRNTSSVRFSVHPASPRARYKLVGLDREWRERTDEMLFIIRFFNKRGDQISQEAFPAVGTSCGWNGSVEKSLFTSRRETVMVPPGTATFSVVISSAGPAALVGVFAVSGITIHSQGHEGTPSVTYLQDGRIPESNSLIWSKSGTHPSMASALHLDVGDSRAPVFIIADHDTKAHADWITQPRSLGKVEPGLALDLQWNEAYCVGLSGAFSATYDRIPAGSYRLEVADLSIEGVPLNTRTVVSVKVPLPYWQNLWFWAGCVAVIAAVSTLYGRRLIRSRINRHLQQAQLIADERLRIARDLHDDLGTRLSHISLLGAYAESNSADQEARSNFGQITAMSRELIGVLSETVWMLNPSNNELEALVDFLCRLVSELCRLAEIRCRIDAMSVTQNVSISHELRHNVSLAVKEVVNNALKHSFASEIKMSIHVHDNLLQITVADNGVGITPDARKNGLGLESISQRMRSIRGTCVREPIEGGGLKVSLEAPIV